MKVILSCKLSDGWLFQMERLLYSFFPKEVTDSLRLTARALFYLNFNSYFADIVHDYIFFTKLVAK